MSSVFVLNKELLFFADQTRFVDYAKSFVSPIPPPQFEELPDFDRRLVHWALAGIARAREPFGWYGLVGVGWSWIADLLVRLECLSVIHTLRGDAYIVTDIGNERLNALNDKYGQPSYPGCREKE